MLRGGPPPVGSRAQSGQAQGRKGDGWRLTIDPSPGASELSGQPEGEEGTAGRTLPAPLVRSARKLLDGDKEATMKLVVALAVLALVSAPALADELGDNDELSYFADWSDGDQNKGGMNSMQKELIQKGPK
ncbi:UNVERIFIED_CONTAM: hypothetical protein K2H54_034246 [Gekko kuhli]